MTQGGYRAPENPAPVSGPGAASQRTDGGPGSDTQPIRVPSGGPYGQRQMLEQAQRDIPLPDTSGLPSTPGAPTGSPPGSPPGGARQDPFGPSLRPGEPGDTGINGRPNLDTLVVLRMLYSQRPSYVLRAMIESIEQNVTRPAELPHRGPVVR